MTGCYQNLMRPSIKDFTKAVDIWKKGKLSRISVDSIIS